MSTIAPSPAPEARPSIPAAAARAPAEPGRARDAEGGAPKVAAANAPNPTLRVDPELGLVVLEFRSAQGETTTHPTSRELDAYRRAARSGKPAPDQFLANGPAPGETPPGSPAPGPATGGPPAAVPAAAPQVPAARPVSGLPVIGRTAPGPAHGAPGGTTAAVPPAKAPSPAA